MDAETVAFLQHVAAAELLAHAGGVLNAAGVRPLVLKGAWLQLEVYDRPERRPLTDVDLLVGKGQFARALDALQTAGYRARSPDIRQVVLHRQGAPLSIDLHRELFMPGSFSLCGADVVARARGPVRHKGVEVMFPDPLDGLAHLVGHAARSRAVLSDARRMGDFEALAERFGLDPVRAAAHLRRVGMRRAARYVLSGAQVATGGFCRAVVQALPADPLGERLVAACHWALLRAGPRLRAASVLTYLLEDSLPRGAVALGMRALTLAARGPRRTTGAHPNRPRQP